MAYTALIEKIEGLSKEAAKKKPKLDPKAKVRNRGECVFPAESPSVTDHQDHFKIGTEGEARNALSRSHQYSSNPPWHKGSLKSLQEAVRRKVHSKYPGIEIGDSKKKKSSLMEKIDSLKSIAQTTPWKAPGIDTGLWNPTETENKSFAPFSGKTNMPINTPGGAPPSAAAPVKPGQPKTLAPQANKSLTTTHNSPASKNTVINMSPVNIVGKQPAAKSAPSGDQWVVGLQRFLMDMGFPLHYGADGKIGAETSNALKRWQEDNGLSPTGQLDKSTLDEVTPLVQPYFSNNATDALKNWQTGQGGATQKTTANTRLDSKIALLHRFAKYGDRADFLASVAQGFDPEAVRQYEGLDEFGNPPTEVMGRNPISFERTTPAVRQPTSFERAKAPVTVMPETTITVTPPDPVIKQVQQKLVDIGLGSTLGPVGPKMDGVDGILGSGTRAALERFKAKAPQYAHLTGKDLYQAILGIQGV